MKTIQLFTMKIMIKSKITVVKRDELGKLIQQIKVNKKMFPVQIWILWREQEDLMWGGR